MNVVLALESDAAQADLLTSIVREKFGAQLRLVDSSQAAIVAINQAIPDAVLLGRSVPQEQRTEIVTHLRSVPEGAQTRTLDIPALTDTAATEAFSRKIGVALAAADYLRKQSMASLLDAPAGQDWDAVALEPSSDSAPTAYNPEIRAADIGLIEAEVEFRLKTELERLQAEAAQQQARELARVEADAAERHAREAARVEAEAAQQRALELAKIEKEAATERESAVAEAKAAAEAAAREALAAELERVRRAGEEQLAAEIHRVRSEAEQMLAAKVDQAQAHADHEREDRIARARAEAEEAKAAAKAATAAAEAAKAAKATAEAAKAAAIDEARRVVAAAAARAKMAEDEVERIRTEADQQLKAAMARAREESDAQLQVEVSRARAETEARLETQLASVIAQAEQLQHDWRTSNVDADTIRMEAAQTARVAAEAALAQETARIRAEANQRLEAEIARLRVEAERAQAQKVAEIPMFAASAGSDELSGFVHVSQTALKGIRWDFVATAALILVVVVAGVLYLPRAISTAARTSSSIVGSAGKAAKSVAKEAAAAAPVVARGALNAAERVIPGPGVVDATNGPDATDPAEAEVPAEPAPAPGPGFFKAFSRIPMDVYADGTRIGNTEDGQQMLLPSGFHRFDFVSEHFHFKTSMTLTILPGHIHPYTVPLPSAQVHVTTTPGAEVWVEGERAGIAPLDLLSVPIGTREIVVKDATGEKRQVVEVKYGDTLELSLIPAAANADGGAATPHLAPLVRTR